MTTKPKVWLAYNGRQATKADLLDVCNELATAAAMIPIAIADYYLNRASDRLLDWLCRLEKRIDRRDRR